MTISFVFCFVFLIIKRWIECNHKLKNNGFSTAQILFKWKLYHLTITTTTTTIVVHSVGVSCCCCFLNLYQFTKNCYLSLFFFWCLMIESKNDWIRSKWMNFSFIVSFKWWNNKDYFIFFFCSPFVQRSFRDIALFSKKMHKKRWWCQKLHWLFVVVVIIIV